MLELECDMQFSIINIILCLQRYDIALNEVRKEVTRNYENIIIAEMLSAGNFSVGKM